MSQSHEGRLELGSRLLAGQIAGLGDKPRVPGAPCSLFRVRLNPFCFILPSVSCASACQRAVLPMIRLRSLFSPTTVPRQSNP